MTDSQRDFLSLIDHVFLPPQLPQSAPKEDEATRVDTLLSQFIFDSSKEYSSQLNNEDQQRWRPIIAMLKQLTCSTSLPPSKTSLYQDLSQMRTHGKTCYLNKVNRQFVQFLQPQTSLPCMYVRKTQASLSENTPQIPYSRFSKFPRRMKQ